MDRQCLEAEVGGVGDVHRAVLAQSCVYLKGICLETKF